MPSHIVRAAKASRSDFESRLVVLLLRRCYGVGDGDSVLVGEGDSSAAFLVAAFFFAGDSAGEADSSAAAVFFLAVVFLVVAACVVVAPVVAVVSSFFCAWQEVKNATVASAVIKGKTDFFIGLDLAVPRMLSRTPDGKH
jgi:hypothetical protein